jgi:hypothetical protein
MYKLTFKKRVWIVKQHLRGVSASKIVLAQKIHRSAICQILDKYNQFGWDGLKDHKTGCPWIVLNQNSVLIILDLRKDMVMALAILSKSSKENDLLLLKSRSHANGFVMSCRIQMTCGIRIGHMIRLLTII